MGEAKRRGTLEQRTKQAIEHFKPQSRRKDFIERVLQKGSPIALAGALIVYPVGLVLHPRKEEKHVPETVTEAAPKIMQAAFQPGSSTSALQSIVAPKKWQDKFFAMGLIEPRSSTS